MTTNVAMADQIAAKWNFLLGHALRFTDDEAYAQDLVQDTIERALTKQHLFDGENINGWLYRIMYRTFINQLRVDQRWVKTDTLSDSLYLNWSGIGLYDNAGEAKVNVELINYAIDQLPPKQKEIMVLRIQGYKYSEIATKAKVRIGTVRGMLFRGKERIVKYMQNPKHDVLAGFTE